MVVVGSAAKRGQKEIKTKYPVDEGLTFGTQKQEGRKLALEPEGNLGQKILIKEKDLEGLE